MDTSAFHFAQPAWLWGMLAIPLLAALYAAFYRVTRSAARLERFADKHLLPHLLRGQRDTARTTRRSLLLWSLIWALAMLAMAGPRWNYTEVASFNPGQSLVIVLDLSRSMDAQDVKPSRLALAREQVEALIRQMPGFNIGLVAFAADAHMVSPITDDAKTVLAMVPYLDTSVPYVQGNNLKPALTMASRMLDAEPGTGKSIIVISDGDATDAASAITSAAGNIDVYALGVGTPEGAPVPNGKSGWLRDDNGSLIMSHLHADTLRAVSRGGIYVQAGYDDGGVHAIASRIAARDKESTSGGQKIRSWEEHVTLLALGMAALLLPWFRKGQLFPMLALFAAMSMHSGNAQADDMSDWFLNKPQQAQAAFDKKDYKKAEAAFDTPYRRGVAQYKAGEFTAAEKSFSEAQTVAPGAQYNLGNAQVMEGKYQDAITSYESLLKRQPRDKEVQHNLDIARKLLEMQKQQQKQDQQKNQQDQKDQKNDQQGKQDAQPNNTDGKGAKNTSDQAKNGQQQQGGEGQDEAGKSGQEQKNRQSNGQPQPADKKPDQGGDSSSGQQPQPGNAQKQAGHQAGQPPAPQPGGQAPQPSAQTGNPESQDAAPASAEAGEKASPDEQKKAVSTTAHPRTQKDIDADQWLNRIDNDPQSFLKNQFMIESVVNGTAKRAGLPEEGVQP